MLRRDQHLEAALAVDRRTRLPDLQHVEHADRQAVELGATNLVVSRPIYQAADPRAAAEAIAREAGVNDL